MNFECICRDDLARLVNGAADLAKTQNKSVLEKIDFIKVVKQFLDVISLSLCVDSYVWFVQEKAWLFLLKLLTRDKRKFNQNGTII